MLNPKMGAKEFLIEGIRLYNLDKGNVILQFEPNWYGIVISIVTSLEKREWNHAQMDGLHNWTKANNLLKNEKFALNGEFLSKTDETWDDLILEPEIKSTIQKTVNYFYEQKERALSRGLLFIGEPGTGKTKTGRILLSKLDTTFIWVSSRDFKQMDAVRTLVTAFDLARNLAPTVLFIEDIDTWLHEYAVDVLKTELDGLKQNKGFLTILTSNCPERLPDALLDRPGRFHHVVDFPLPGANQRRDMIQTWAGIINKTILESIVEGTKGYSGAHLKELVDFAQIIIDEEGLDIAEALLDSLERLQKQRELIATIRESKRGKELITVPIYIGGQKVEEQIIKIKETEIVIEPDKPIEVVLDVEPPVKPTEIVLEPEPVKKESDIVKAYLNSEDFKAHVNESIRHELARLRGKVE
jgi:SpoVK/Ycf46/Vps4 family AAA+-type ATPase